MIYAIVATVAFLFGAGLDRYLTRRHIDTMHITFTKGMMDMWNDGVKHGVELGWENGYRFGTRHEQLRQLIYRSRKQDV